jgi:hypothetical protein
MYVCSPGFDDIPKFTYLTASLFAFNRELIFAPCFLIFNNLKKSLI